MKNIEINKIYLLTRIYRSQEQEHDNQIMSACLEPIFTNFDEVTFEENLNRIVMLSQDNATDLLEFLNAQSNDENFLDGTFVQIIDTEGRRIFEVANDSPDAQAVIREYNSLTEAINETHGL